MNVCFPITSGKQEIPRSTCFSDRTENLLPGKQQQAVGVGVSQIAIGPRIVNILERGKFKFLPINS